jgi:iron(III) transport system ATP-binding protein
VRLAATGGLSATVRRATYMGSQCEYVLETALGPFFAVLADPRPPRYGPGDAVTLELDPEGVILVAP